MKFVLTRRKLIALLLCVTMVFCFAPFGPLAAFGEDGDLTADAPASDAIDSSSEGNETTGEGTDSDIPADEATGEETDPDTPIDETSGDGTDSDIPDDEETTEGTGGGTEEMPDGEENQPVDGEQQEEEIVGNDVPKTEAPAENAHVDGCSDECDGVDCTCPCHLYERFMACETYEELMEMIEATPEEELLALTEDEVMRIKAKIIELEPEPLPPVVLEEDDAEADEPFISEIIYPTVNFDFVAPLGAPVVG